MPTAIDGDTVWVFSGGGRFPAAVFRTIEPAEAWIARERLTGTLTAYPLDVSALDWALANGFFEPRANRTDQVGNPSWVGGFTSASQPHHHYEDGVRRG